MSNANAFFTNNSPFNAAYDPNANPALLDPLAFNGLSPANLDLQQFANPQLQQQVNNGDFRHQSPNFFQAPQQINSVIPAKRSRPSEDDLGTPPLTTAANMDAMRVHTPQHAQFNPAFLAQHGGMQFQAPTPYQHLQPNGSTQATPSPTMQNQQFRPQSSGPPQRMQTNSPHQFQQSDARFQNMPQQMHAGVNRMHPTPQPAAQQFMPVVPFDAQFGQSMQAMPNMMPNNMTFAPQNQGLVSANPAVDMAAQYRMRMQQQERQQQFANPNAHRPQQQRSPMAPSSNGQPQGNNGAMLSRMLQIQDSIMAQRAMQEPSFMRNLAQFLQARGQVLPNDIRIQGRMVNVFVLFALITKFGGSKQVMDSGGWPNVAVALGWPPAPNSSVPDELRGVFQQHLGAYEAQYWSQIQKKRMMQKQSQLSNQMQMSPNGIQMMNPSLQNPSQVQQMQQPMVQMQNRAPPVLPPQQQPNMVNAMTPQPSRKASMNGSPPSNSKASASPAPQPEGFMMQQRMGSRPPSSFNQDPATQAPTQTPPRPASSKEESKTLVTPAPPADLNGITKPEPVKPFDPKYVPKLRRISSTHGGLHIATMADFGNEIRDLRPSIPSIGEMGVLDLRAVTMSIASGIHGEMRYALDQLVKLSSEMSNFRLELYEELIDALIDCAEEQIDVLARSSAESTGSINLPSFEDLLRAGQAEFAALQDLPEFASESFELNCAAERLLAVTRILRNSAEFEKNQKLLSNSTVVKSIASMIRLLGTRKGLLRKASHMHDFMEDLVVFLSNTADRIEVSGKEDAVALLHLLLCFAPAMSLRHDVVRFGSFTPSIHQHLPAAVDSLAKLLARDHPNRTYYKAIFQADVSSSPPYHLLTRAFALAVSPIPQWEKGGLPRQREISMTDARSSFFSQGMLAADILASLAPGSEQGLTRSWLESEDGFACNLLRLTRLLMDRDIVPRAQLAGKLEEFETHPYDLITHRALSMLRRLAEKTQRADNLGFLADLLPVDDTVLKALSTPKIDVGALQQLCALSKVVG